MPKLFTRFPALFSLLITVLYMGFILRFFASAFASCDDVEMQQVLSGTAMGEGHYGALRYTHIWTGNWIKALYQWRMDWPWYGMYWYAIQAISIFSIGLVVLRRGAHIYALLAWILYLVGVHTWFIQNLQFTASAILVGIAGGFIVREALLSKFSRMLALFALGWGLFLLSSMGRAEAFFLSFALSLPVMLLTDPGVKNILPRPRVFIRNSLMISLIAISGWGIWIIHKHALDQNPIWAQWHNADDTKVRVSIHDFHDARYDWNAQTAGIYQQVGWDKNDYDLFKSWFIADTSVYGQAAMQQLKTLSKQMPAMTLAQRFERVKDFIGNMPFVLMLMGALHILLLLHSLKQARTTLVLSLAIGSVWAIALYLTAYKHLPDRVYYPLFAFPFLLGISHAFQNAAWKLWLRVILIAGLIWSIVVFIPRYYKRSRAIVTQEQVWRDALQDIAPQSHELFVGSGGLFSEKIIRPFTAMNDPLLYSFHAVDFGHFSNIPVYYRKLKRFNIKQLHAQIANRDNVMLLCGLDDVFLSRYKAFIKRHYQLSVQFELVHHIEDINMAVYKVKPEA